MRVNLLRISTQKGKSIILTFLLFVSMFVIFSVSSIELRITFLLEEEEKQFVDFV